MNVLGLLLATINGGLVVAVIIAVLAVVFVAKGLKIVKQSEAIIIERLGKYNGTLNAGLNLIIPFF